MATLASFIGSFYIPDHFSRVIGIPEHKSSGALLSHGHSYFAELDTENDADEQKDGQDPTQ